MTRLRRAVVPLPRHSAICRPESTFPPQRAIFPRAQPAAAAVLRPWKAESHFAAPQQKRGFIPWDEASFLLRRRKMRFRFPGAQYGGRRRLCARKNRALRWERALRAANRAVSWQGDDGAAQPCQRGNAEDAKCKKTGLKDAAKSVFSFFTLSHLKRGVCCGIFLSGEDRQTGKERPLLLCYKRGFVSGPPFLAAAQQLKWRTAKWPAAVFIASQ